MFVEDVDQAFQRAIDAGATVEAPVQDMFWGDRYSKVIDPFGQMWSIAHSQTRLYNRRNERTNADGLPASQGSSESLVMA